MYQKRRFTIILRLGFVFCVLILATVPRAHAADSTYANLYGAYVSGGERLPASFIQSASRLPDLLQLKVETVDYYPVSADARAPRADGVTQGQIQDVRGYLERRLMEANRRVDWLTTQEDLPKDILLGPNVIIGQRSLGDDIQGILSGLRRDIDAIDMSAGSSLDLSFVDGNGDLAAAVVTEANLAAAVQDKLNAIDSKLSAAGGTIAGNLALTSASSTLTAKGTAIFEGSTQTSGQATFSGNTVFAGGVSFASGVTFSNPADFDSTVDFTNATITGLTSGVIPDLPTSKITSGMFDEARLPNSFSNRSFTGTLDLIGAVVQDGNAITFEGDTANAFETVLAVADPTADRTITLPNQSGTIALLSDVGSGNFLQVSNNLFDLASAVTARANLGLTIGTNVQAYDADLATYAGITPSANVQSLLGSADLAAARTNLGLAIGTNVQAYDASLASIAGLSTTANQGIYTTGSDNYATFDLTVAGRALLNDADASTQRTTLGLAIGTNVQAYDADLATYAGITPSANVQSLLGSADLAAARTNLGLGSLATANAIDISGNTNLQGGTNLTLVDDTLNVDDVFVTNNADDTMVGDLTIDDDDAGKALVVRADYASTGATVGILVSTEADDNANYTPFQIRDDSAINNDTLFTIDYTGTVTTGIWGGTAVAVARGGTGATTLNDLITLGAHTTGNYVATVSAGSGISGSSSTEGGTPTLALGALSEDWAQSGAYDVVLAHADSELKLLESTGNTYYGILDVGDLAAADATYTFSGTSGTVYTSVNDPLDSISEWQALCTNCADIVNDTTGTLSVARGGTGVTELTNFVALGTHTTGNYVASISDGAGITGGDGGAEASGLTLTVDQSFTPTWTGDQTFTPSGTNDHNINLDADSSMFVSFVSGANMTSGMSLEVTNEASSGTIAVLGQGITLTGTNNVSGANTIYGISFDPVTPATNNTFIGLDFGTGLTDILRYNDTQIISGAGIVQSAALSGSYTGITGVGTITAGTWSATDIAVAAGGTGASDAATARTNLGVAIGSDVQAYDADLTTYAGITPSPNVQTLLGSADYATVRTNLGLAIGTNVQAYDADLTTYAGIAPSANIQSLLGSADYVTARTNLGLAIGTNVQAYDADLDDLADGSLTGSKVGSGIAAGNITSGTLADSILETTVDRTIFNASDYITALGGVHVGGTSDPGTDNLVVDGYVLTGSYTSFAPVVGNNNNINVGGTSYVEITSAGGNFTITGIAGGVAGRRLTIVNLTSSNMTIATNDSNSTVGNRTHTLGSTVTTTASGTVDLIYSDASGTGYWIVTSWMP